MKRGLALAVVALACSRNELDVPPSGPWPPPTFARASDCVASQPAVKACSGLRVLTPKQPIALDPSFVDDASAELVAARGGGLEILSAAGDLVHLDVGGSPPVVTVASTSHLLPAGDRAFMGAATDGHYLYACAERGGGLPVNDELVHDETNTLVESFGVYDSIEGYCMLAARDGLALTAYIGWNQTSPSAQVYPGAALLADATGIRWWRGGLGAPFGATAYGCGFAYVAPTDGNWRPPAVVTMLPLDGASETSSAPLDIDWEGPLYPWPYDARTVALLTRPEASGATQGQCPIRIDLVHDDGTLETRITPHDCAFPIATEGQVVASLAMASFGAVLHDGAGNFQLLDAHAQPIGAPVSVALIPYISDVVVGAFGDWVVVLTAEDDHREGNVVVSQTILGCE